MTTVRGISAMFDPKQLSPQAQAYCVGHFALAGAKSTITYNSPERLTEEAMAVIDELVEAGVATKEWDRGKLLIGGTELADRAVDAIGGPRDLPEGATDFRIYRTDDGPPSP